MSFQPTQILSPGPTWETIHHSQSSATTASDDGDQDEILDSTPTIKKRKINTDSSLSPDKRKRPKPRPVQSVAQPGGSSSSHHSRLSSGFTLKDKGKQEYQSSRSSRDSTPDFEGASQMWNALGSLRPATATTSPMAEGSTSTPAPVAHQSVTDSRPKIGSRRKVVARKSTGGGPLFRPKSTQSEKRLYIASSAPVTSERASPSTIDLSSDDSTKYTSRWKSTAATVTVKRTVDPDVINLCDDTDDDEAPLHAARKTNGEAQKEMVINTKVKDGVIEILSDDEEDLSPAQISGKFGSPDPTSFSHSSPPITDAQTISPTPTISKYAARVSVNDSSPPLEFPVATPSPPTYNDIEMDVALEFRSEGLLEDSQIPQFRSPTQPSVLPSMPEAALSPAKDNISLPIGCISSSPHSSVNPCDKVIQSSVSVQPADPGSQTTPIGSLPAKPSSLTPTSRFRKWGPSQANKGPFKNMHKALDLSRRTQTKTSIHEEPVNFPSQARQQSKVGEMLAQTSVQTIGPNTESSVIAGPPSNIDLSVYDQPPLKPLAQASASKSTGMSISKPASFIRPIPSIPRRKADPTSLPAPSTLLSRNDGRSLSDVIEEAYRKPSPAIVDLTLDNSDEDETPLLKTLKQSADNLWRLLEKDDSNQQQQPTTQSEDLDASFSKLTNQQPSFTTENSKNAINDSSPVPKRLSLDGIRTILRKRNATSNTSSGQHTEPNVNKVLQTTPQLDRPRKASASPSSRQVDPVIFENLVDNVGAMSMEPDVDVQMQDGQADKDIPSLALVVTTDVQDTRISAPGHLEDHISSSEEEDRDSSAEEVDDLLRKNPRSGSIQLESSPSSGDEGSLDPTYCDYVKEPQQFKGSPLKNEITCRSSEPSALIKRRSSRLSDRSSRSSSNDPIDTIDEVGGVDDVVVYNPQISIGTSNDAANGDSTYITWRQAREAARSKAPSYRKARDLPHTLQDHMNIIPAAYRATPMARIIFEAAMRESSIKDEPHAPPIGIINEIDDETTPPWEFHYTNEMWYGEGVPGPDTKNLQGCDCEGTCDPKSKICQCLQKQLEYSDGTGSVYDTKGRLRESTNFPIWECNELCGCGEGCYNRVVQHGRKVSVNIVKTKEKGWGVFANDKKIPRGSFVGIYAGELVRDSVAEERGLVYNAFGKTYLFDVDGWHLKRDNPEWESIYAVDAYHAGNFTRFLNHSCDPNCIIALCYINDADINKPLLAIFTTQDINPWGELCFSYAGFPDDQVEAAAQQSRTGAVYAQCRCGAENCKGVMWK